MADAKQPATPKPTADKVLQVGTDAHKFMLRVESVKGMMLFTVVVKDGVPVAWQPQSFEYVNLNPS